MTEAQYLSGRLLLAMPGMGDPRFDHAAIAMCVHDEHGALGIGVGHVREGVTLHPMLRELGIEPGLAPDCEIMHGGPVEPGRGFVLHSADWGGSGTIAVEPWGAMSATLDVLRAIAEGRGPGRWLIALGYAGWGPGQLEGEMRSHGWFAARASGSILFETEPGERWTAAWRAHGVDPAQLVGQTGRA